MDFFENQIVEDKNKNKKLARKLIIAAVIILILCLGIGVLIVYLQSLQLKISFDGTPTSFSEQTFSFEENGKVYISIEEMAKKLGYTYYKGEYGQASEDITKGYIQGKDEIAMFEMNSKKIYKTTPNNTSSDYSYFYIDEPIKQINGKLYTTPEGIGVALNTSFTYEQEKNSISIFTLSYLYNFYNPQVVNYGYKQINNQFNNQKAMLESMLVVENDSGKKGVIDLKGTEVIGAKYDEVTYNETTGDFFVSGNGKKGLVDKQGKTKIALLYDEIQMLDKDLGLYLVKISNKSGILNQDGEVVVFLEYDKIGVERSLYKTTTIKNPYLLYDNCIPVQKNGKWELLDKNGQYLLPESLRQLDGLGCVIGTSNNRSADNVLLLSDYEAIVVQKNKKYGLVNSVGQELIPCGLDTVYSITSAGVTTYQMEYQGKTLNVETYLEDHGIRKVTVNNNQVDTSGQVNVTTNDTNIVTTDTNNTQQNQTDTNPLNGNEVPPQVDVQ